MEIQIIETKDRKAIHKILTDEQLWEHISNEESPAPEDFKVPIGEGIHWLLTNVNNKCIGCFFVHTEGDRKYLAHANILPEYWGTESTVPAGQQAVDWVFNNTDCITLTAKAPTGLKVVNDYLLNIGFDISGVDYESLIKDGSRLDQFVWSLERETWQQQ